MAEEEMKKESEQVLVDTLFLFFKTSAFPVIRYSITMSIFILSSATSFSSVVKRL